MLIEAIVNLIKFIQTVVCLLELHFVYYEKYTEADEPRVSSQ